MEKKEKVQPHCNFCAKPFKRTDKVYTDTMFTQILHTKCFPYSAEFIKDRGTYEEIVNKYPDYKKSFIVSDNPITDLLVVSAHKEYFKNSNSIDCIVEIKDELLEQYDFEGTLINPQDPQTGLLVLSNKDNTFTLHFYRLELKCELKFHIVKELTTRKFPSFVDMEYFLNSFSNYNSDEFMEFINKYDNP